MIKRVLAVLLTVVSLCVAWTSAPMFAYTPFPMEGLDQHYKNKNHGKYGYAPSTVYYNGAYHQFYCSNGQDSDNLAYIYDGVNGWPADHIRYRTSKDGVHWSAPRVVMHVKNPEIEMGTCDPSVVKGDDGFWYMLYTGAEKGYDDVIYLARSNFIQGPYFKYTNKGWENEVENGTPKFVLGTEAPSNCDKGCLSIAQQTVVKDPDGYFRVWFKSGTGESRKNDFKYAAAKDLTKLDYNQSDVIFFCDSKIECEKPKKEWKSFSESFYHIGDVRLNFDRNGRRVWEMWCLAGYMAEATGIVRFEMDESDGSKKFIYWRRVGYENNDDLKTYGYNFIHNMGVSGNEYGWINGKYLISFSAPYLDGRNDNADPQKALKRELTVLDDEYGFNISCHTNPDAKCNLGGYWAMWQVLVDGGVNSNRVYYPASGLLFPEGDAIGANIDYFTGDYDGDGITDLGAVDRSTFRWYIRSTRTGRYIVNGKKMIEEMDSNFVVIAGDYDGDGKTDIGAVDKVNGRWYIRSSAKKNGNAVDAKKEEKEIGDPSSLPYIPWGWLWNGMDSSYVVFTGDYDGDGKADRAVYSAPYWSILSSMSNNFAVLTNAYGDKFPLGWRWDGVSNKDIVVPGDFDGDGITDRTIYKTSSGQWSSYSSRLGGQKNLTWQWKRACKNADELWSNCTSMYWGKTQRIENFAPCDSCKGMLPVLGDFDGDGVDDLVQVDLSSGVWHIYGSLNYEKNFPDGREGCWSRLKYSENPVILTGDFDGDGKADRAFADKKSHKFYVISSKDHKEGINTTVKAVSDISFLAKSASEKSIEEPKVAPVVPKAPSMDVSVRGQKVSVSNVESGSNVIVFNMLGKKIFSTVANGNSVNFELPSRGKFIIRAGSQSRSIVVK